MLARVPKEVATTILLAVNCAGKLTMSELYEKTKFSTITILNHVNALIKSGLLEEEREGTFPKKRLIKVSKEGGRVAMMLNLADQSTFSTQDLIDMGAKAGRIASYQEMLGSLRNPGATREYLIAELLLKNVGTRFSGLELVAKGLPESMADKADELKSWSEKLKAYYNDGQKRFSLNDVNGCASVASRALVEFNGATDVMRDMVKQLKEQRYYELANYLEFISPKSTQKE